MQWYIILPIVFGGLLGGYLVFLLLMAFECPQRQYPSPVISRLIPVSCTSMESGGHFAEISGNQRLWDSQLNACVPSTLKGKCPQSVTGV